MGFEAALVTRLNAVTAITDLVGEAVSWFERVRGDGSAALVLNKISPGRDYTHGGAIGLDRPRVRFDCWAPDEVTAKALAAACLAEMELAADAGGWRFHPAQLAAERDLPEGEQDGGTALFRVQQEYLVYIEETD